MMKQDAYDVLRFNDQLYIELKCGFVPKCLQEGLIEFAPTFKRKAGSNTEYGHKRTPAWTDRILYAFNQHTCKLSQKVYDSNNSVMLSDHRPVFSQFLLTFDLCGEGFGKGCKDLEKSFDDVEVSYTGNDIQVR